MHVKHGTGKVMECSWKHVIRKLRHGWSLGCVDSERVTGMGCFGEFLGHLWGVVFPIDRGWLEIRWQVVVCVVCEFSQLIWYRFGDARYFLSGQTYTPHPLNVCHMHCKRDHLTCLIMIVEPQDLTWQSHAVVNSIRKEALTNNVNADLVWSWDPTSDL
jgi:hypothetical protein